MDVGANLDWFLRYGTWRSRPDSRLISAARGSYIYSGVYADRRFCDISLGVPHVMVPKICRVVLF